LQGTISRTLFGSRLFGCIHEITFSSPSRSVGCADVAEYRAKARTPYAHAAPEAPHGYADHCQSDKHADKYSDQPFSKCNAHTDAYGHANSNSAYEYSDGGQYCYPYR